MTKGATTICICGIGPGNPDYILPLVHKKVATADVLIGGKRQLELFLQYSNEKYVFLGKLDELKIAIERFMGKVIVVLVSGDTGFYSLRKFISNTFIDIKLELIPGISSFQYFYSKLGLGYEDACLLSLHGKKADYIAKLQDNETVFLLTDSKHNYVAIAQTLVSNDLGQCMMHIGSRLSYEDEKIISCTAQQALTINMIMPLCSVIIQRC